MDYCGSGESLRHCVAQHPDSATPQLTAGIRVGLDPQKSILVDKALRGDPFKADLLQGESPLGSSIVLGLSLHP